jgi:hypothetical protein
MNMRSPQEPREGRSAASYLFGAFCLGCYPAVVWGGARHARRSDRLDTHRLCLHDHYLASARALVGIALAISPGFTNRHLHRKQNCRANTTRTTDL